MEVPDDIGEDEWEILERLTELVVLDDTAEPLVYVQWTGRSLERRREK